MRFLILLFGFLAGAVLAVLMFMGCDQVDIVVEVDTAQDVDAGVSDCAAACANLELLGCDGAEGSPGLDEEYGTSDDVPCDQVCRETEAGGIPMHTACVAAAGSCDVVDECFD